MLPALITSFCINWVWLVSTLFDTSFKSVNFTSWTDLTKKCTLLLSGSIKLKDTCQSLSEVLEKTYSKIISGNSSLNGITEELPLLIGTSKWYALSSFSLPVKAIFLLPSLLPFVVKAITCSP